MNSLDMGEKNFAQGTPAEIRLKAEKELKGRFLKMFADQRKVVEAKKEWQRRNFSPEEVKAHMLHFFSSAGGKPPKATVKQVLARVRLLARGCFPVKLDVPKCSPLKNHRITAKVIKRA